MVEQRSPKPSVGVRLSHPLPIIFRCLKVALYVDLTHIYGFSVDMLFIYSQLETDSLTKNNGYCLNKRKRR